MKRVLVTGASGFLGRHTLAPLVARGYEVHAAARHTLPVCEHVTWHQLDLLDPVALRALVRSLEPTHLLHAAWLMTPGVYARSPENLAWVRASLVLLEEFAAQRGRRAVGVGTCFEYDSQAGLCSEQTALASTSLYGSAKIALQEVASAFARESSISFAWARVFFLYGPHEHPSRLVASVVRSLLSDEPARCSHGEQVRDLLHIEDAGAALAAVLDAPVEGPINVASGHGIALKEVILRAADKLGRRHLVQLGAIQAPPHEPPAIVADVTRLSRETGWTPSYDLDAGLDHTIAWWRTRLSERG